MADNSSAPSQPKRARKVLNSMDRKRPLSLEELERILAESDFESDCDLSDTENSASDAEGEFSSGDDDEMTAAELDQPDEPGFPNVQGERQEVESDKNDSHQVPPVIPVDRPVVWHQNPNLRDFHFTKAAGLLVPSPGNKAIDYFNLLVTDEFYELIVEETNKYAEVVFLSKANYDRSRINNWKTLTVPELKIFFGLTLHMGTVRLNRIQDYWKTDRLFDFKAFSNYMSRDRYLVILRCLHFSTNPLEGEMQPHDRLFKIRPLINYFNKKIAETYYPAKELSLDESMVLWQGRLQFRQYIPNKKHKYGVKLYMLCEPNGIVLKFAVYTGALGDMGGTGHSDRIVLHLLEEKLNAGHAIYMDNFYNSYTLSKTLLEQNTYATGTLRISRKNTPIDVTTAKLKKGETVCRYSEGVMIGKWKDKREVAYISTEHDNAIVTYKNRRNVDHSKPKAIMHYNKYMGGVDRQDQYLAYYPFTRKTVRWYKKIGIHILQLLLMNAHLLYCKYEKRQTFYDFRLEVIKVLLPEKMHNKIQHKVLNHFVSHCEQSRTTGKSLRRKCRQCISQGIRKDTPYLCKECNAGFCLEPCFKEYHDKFTA